MKTNEYIKAASKIGFVYNVEYNMAFRTWQNRVERELGYCGLSQDTLDTLFSNMYTDAWSGK